jgi:phosphoribosylaminoimidazolecarboxamide formyltransferase/IMP cyclohydrolase
VEITKMSKIIRAICSVTDKTGLPAFALSLQRDFGIELLSTGGTAKALRDAGLKVMDVSEYTGFPEMMDGRVKTLHPRVHGGIIHRRNMDDDLANMKEHGIKPIDLVVVNLYAFEKTVAKPGISIAEAIEAIDIGGSSMLRCAAKNFKWVTVVVDPADYPRVLADMKANDGQTTLALRWELADKVFGVTAAYDAAIHKFLGEQRRLRNSEEQQ